MLIEFGESKVEARANLKALYLYEQEFGSDMVKDMFGTVTVGDLDKAMGDQGEDADENTVVLDFTQVDWLGLSKCLWACIKACDNKVPSYVKWLDTVADVDVNLMELNGQVGEVLQDGLFRLPTATATEDQEA